MMKEMIEHPPSLEFRLPWALRFEDASLEGCDSLSSGSPSDVVLGRTRDGLYGQATFLGKVAETAHFDKKLWLDVQGAHAVYVVGKRRAGKTHTLAVICEGLAGKGWMTQCEKRQAILVFDTMNVFLTASRDRTTTVGSEEEAKWELTGAHPRVQLWRPGGTPAIVGYEIPQLYLGGHDLTAEEWIHTFGVDQFADVLGHLMFDAYERVRFSGYTTANGRVAPRSRFGLSDLEKCVATSRELSTFRDDTRQAAIRRFRALSRNSIFDGKGLDLRTLLQPGQITVLLLRDLPAETRELFVSVLIRRIQAGRSETEHYERLLSSCRNESAEAISQWKEKVQHGIPRCWLVIDEAHNYIPNAQSAISRRPLKKLIDEGRNLGISVVAATQQPSGLDSSIRRNADVLMIHPMSMEEDIRVVAGMLSGPWPKKSYVVRGGIRRASDFFGTVRSLPRGYALVSSESLPRVAAIRIRPRVTESGDSGY